MKILVFTGGLGNQIFGYAFYTYLKQRYPNESIYGIYSDKKMSEHHGLEIDRYFNVTLPKTTLLAKVVTGMLYIGKKLGISKHLVDMGTREFDPKTIVNSPCKTNINLMPEGNNWISFKEPDLSEQNKRIVELVQNTESVFIHVRRGDYYSPQYIKKLGGTCPIEYYEKSLALMNKDISNPKFYVFSDDIEWVKQNINIPDPTYIDWNTGENSYIDMYLMSLCKYAIIANSTFSYWGARLGTQKKIVCFPEKWVNPPYTAPNICPSNWHKL